MIGLLLAAGMTNEEQIDAFARELESLISRYRSEFDLTYAATVGVLTLTLHDMMSEATEE